MASRCYEGKFILLCDFLVDEKNCPVPAICQISQVKKTLLFSAYQGMKTSMIFTLVAQFLPNWLFYLGIGSPGLQVFQLRPSWKARCKLWHKFCLGFWHMHCTSWHFVHQDIIWSIAALGFFLRKNSHFCCCSWHNVWRWTQHILQSDICTF